MIIIRLAVYNRIQHVQALQASSFHGGSLTGFEQELECFLKLRDNVVYPGLLARGSLLAGEISAEQFPSILPVV